MLYQYIAKKNWEYCVQSCKNWENVPNVMTTLVLVSGIVDPHPL